MHKSIYRLLNAIRLGLSAGVVLSGMAHAASFDCAIAQSKVEKMVCDNPELSKLDDELAESYRAALREKNKAEATKRAQKSWLKGRDACEDMACLNNAYITRHASLFQSAPTLDAKLQVQPLPQTNAKARYGHCADVDGGSRGCETGHLAKTGKGYAVCENYLKHLNAVPEISKCEAPVPPGFKRPELQDLDITSHLQLAYQAEALKFVGRGGYKHPDFETWKQQFMSELQVGKIAPQLRKTTVQPFGEKAITLLAYTRDREGCKAVTMGQESWWGDTGHVYFLLTDDPKDPLRTIASRISRDQSELLLYAGKPYFVLPDRYTSRFEIIAFDKNMTDISAQVATMNAFEAKHGVSPPPDANKEFLPDPNVYWAGQLCHFVPIKQPKR